MGKKRKGRDSKDDPAARHDEEEQRDRDTARLLPGIIRGDVDAVIEYLSNYGGEEWREE